MKNPKVLIAQIEIIPDNLNANIEKIKKYFNEAKKEDCDFIIFPEFLDGNMNFKEMPNAEQVIKFKKELSSLSKENKIYCIAGTILEKIEDNVFDNCYVFDRDGKILGVQGKRALVWHDEINNLTSDKESRIFETEFAKIGIMVCRDFLYPEIADELTNKGAKIIFSPAFWSQYSTNFSMNKIELRKELPLNSEILVIKAIVPSRAIENECVFVYCNAALGFQNQIKKEVSAGHSQIAMPFFGTKHIIEHNQEETILGEINLQIVEDAKNSYKIKETNPIKK